MKRERLTCHICYQPLEDGAPELDAMFDVLDELAERIADFHRAAGRVVDDFSTDWPGHGSLMTVNSDAPSGNHYFWIVLPDERRARTELLGDILATLSRARATCAEAVFSVSLESGAASQTIELL
ncbi:MAG TPA: hypothetical protein VF449_12825 [Parvibaculum sp.]